MQIKLSQSNESELARVVKESRQLFSITALTNMIVTEWCLARNESKSRLKSIYGQSKTQISGRQRKA